MPSIFDLLNPQQAALAPAVPRPPSILDSPDYRSDRLGDALAGMAQALVKAGGPSQYPQGFAEAFGAAGSGAVQGTQGSEEKYLKRAMVNAQVQAAEESLRADKAFRDLLNGAGSAPATATAGLPGAAAGPAVPTPAVPGGGPSNPTNPGNLANGQGGFQSFPTPEAGVAAAIKNVQSYPAKYNGGQPMSLIQIGQAWAPKDDGKTPQLRGNDPVVWANNVAKAGGLDPNQPLDFNDPTVALKFAQGVHVAEHGQGKGYAPDVYQRGVSLAMGGPPPPVNPVGPVAAIPPQGDAIPTPAPVQTDGAPPPAATGSPVQLAQAPGGAPPQQAGPVPPIAPGPAVGPRSLQEVIQTMPPGVRQLVGAMGRKEGMGQILKYADPGTHVAIDTAPGPSQGQIVFAPTTDKSGRYVPVDVMKLDIERQNAASQAKQAAAREEANRIRGANEPMQPGVNGGPPTPTPGFPEAKGAITGAEEGAKVGPELLRYQGQAAIKDHEGSQQAAAKARNSNNNLTQLSTLLQGIDTGKMTATTQEIKAYAKAAGFNLDAMGIKDDVANTQAATALLSQMALEMRSTGEGNGMPGSLSDSDRNFLTSMTPGLATTPEGRTLMVDYQKRLNQRTIDVANIKNKYMQGKQFAENPAGMWEAVGKFVDSHPLFDPAKDKMPAAAAAPAAATGGLADSIDAEQARRKAAKGAK